MFSALIIDADGKTPATLKSILAPYGFEFTVTENGPEAVNVARQAAPDIILLRAELPLTTGFSVCNRLRRNEDTRKIPLVLYSSNASDEVIEQHRNLKTHADQYLRLPVDAERLVTAVKSFLSLPDRAAAARPARAESRPESRADSRADSRTESRADSRAESKAKPRLDVELSEPSGARPPPGPNQQFDRDFGDEFGNLAGELQQAEEDDHTVAVRRAAEPSRDHGRALSEESAARRLSAVEPAAEGEGGFKAQREALQLKGQLNAKNREILALKDDLESRERAVLDAKKHHRELLAQLGDMETQLVGSQEQILSSREAVEAAQRDKQTVLKREEGLKTRLEVTQKKLKEAEQLLTTTAQQLSTAQAQLHATQQQGVAAAADARGRIEAQAAALLELEGERDALVARVQALGDTVGQLERSNAELVAQLEQARQDLADGLSAAAESHAAAIATLGAQHQAELDERDQDQRGVVEGLQLQQLEQTEKSQAERERMNTALQETEENARQQIAQLSQHLTSIEESARTEIQRVTQNLAAAEAHAHAEIQRLQQDAEQAGVQAQADAEDAARKVHELEATLDDLSGGLDRAEAALHRRREAVLHAQQAIAVALRVLDASSDSDSP